MCLLPFLGVLSAVLALGAEDELDGPAVVFLLVPAFLAGFSLLAFPLSEGAGLSCWIHVLLSTLRKSPVLGSL